MNTCSWFIVAAGRDSGADWFEVIPLLIFALIWAGGLIVKVMQSKSQPRPTQKPARQQGQMELDLEGFVRMVRQKYREANAEQMRQAPHQPPADRPGTSRPPPVPQTHTGPQPVPIPAVIPAVPTRPQVAPIPPVIPSELPLRRETVPSLQEQIIIPEQAALPVPPNLASSETHTEHSRQETKSYLVEVLGDLSSADGFRAALLHYEVLGKPLALRGEEFGL